ncbi:MAG: RCC1 domain-containing protein [Polyangiaceae bacterium]
MGANDAGQLGAAAAEVAAAGHCASRPHAGAGGLGREAHGCALLEDGSVSCWGSPEAALGATPGAKVAGVSGAVAIASGDSNTCALDAEGAPTCWGSNGRGQRGAGDVGGIDRPPTQVGLDRVTRIAVGERTCAVTAGMHLFCWGETVAYAPVRADLTERATSLALGAGRSCAETERGSFCWGDLDARFDLTKPRPVRRIPELVDPHRTVEARRAWRAPLCDLHDRRRGPRRVHALRGHVHRDARVERSPRRDPRGRRRRRPGGRGVPRVRAPQERRRGVLG